MNIILLVGYLHGAGNKRTRLARDPHWRPHARSSAIRSWRSTTSCHSLDLATTITTALGIKLHTLSVLYDRILIWRTWPQDRFTAAASGGSINGPGPRPQQSVAARESITYLLFRDRRARSIQILRFPSRTRHAFTSSTYNQSINFASFSAIYDTKEGKIKSVQFRLS